MKNNKWISVLALLLATQVGAAPKTRFQNDVVMKGALDIAGTLGVTGVSTFVNAVSTGAMRIGSSGSADSKSVLDLVSTTKGFLPPRMNTTQRDAIVSPTTGLTIYNTTTNQMNLYNGAAWGAVAGAGGSGGINYFSANPDAESDTAGWTTYADTAKNIPADGTGGSPSSTWTRTSSSPLVGIGSFLWTKAGSANRQGEGVSFPFTIDSAFQATSLSLTFNYKVASGTFTAADGITAPLNDNTTTDNAGMSDLEVFVYDVTNSILIPVSPQVLTSNSGTGAQFKATFQAASNSTSYRFILHTAKTTTNNFTAQFDNFVLGPQPILQGAPITDLNVDTALTFSSGFGTIANRAVNSGRQGDRFIASGSYQTGTVAAATTYISLPSGLSMDTSKFTNSTAVRVVGYFTRSPAAASSAIYPGGNAGVLFYDGSDATKIFFATGSGANVLTKFNANDIFGSSEYGSFDFSVPIAGWSSTVQMSNDTSASVVQATGNNQTPTGTLGASYNVIKYGLVTNDTHAGYSTSTGLYTVPVSGFYECTGIAEISGTYAVNGFSFIGIGVNGSIKLSGGPYAQSTSLTQISPQFTHTVYAKAGDTIGFYSYTTASSASYSNTTTGGGFSIKRISGPSTIATTDNVSFSYSNVAGTSIADGSYTLIPFATKDFDRTGMFNTGTSLATAQVSGTYRVTALVTPGASATGIRALAVYKNGSLINYLDQKSGSASLTTFQGSKQLSLLPGDTIGIYMFQNSGGPLTLDSTAGINYFEMQRTGN